MKRVILFLVCLTSMTFAFAQSSLQDVVYLKNGSVIRGDIIEMVPGETVKIKTFDESVFVLAYADVKKSTKEERVMYVPQTAIAENGFVMYQINDRCAFGMQPSIAYERPQYMQGAKPELAAGMNFRLTF